MKNRFCFLLVAALLFVLSGAVVEAQEKTVSRFVATVGSDGIQKVEVVGGSYFYKPNYIVVKVNIPVEMSVSKESGLVPHDIEMKSPEAGMNFNESLSTTPKIIRFTPTKTGTYPFYCTHKLPFTASHREKGMEGTIEVVP